MQSVWLQLIITLGSVLGAMFITIRYAIGQSAKKEKVFLDYIQETQEKQLEYYTVKNGHMERIAKSFTLSSNKMSKAISKLSTQVAVLEK